jgi:PAB-dependent poly(A)-specific ribonuclease subunit 3
VRRRLAAHEWLHCRKKIFQLSGAFLSCLQPGHKLHKSAQVCLFLVQALRSKRCSDREYSTDFVQVVAVLLAASSSSSRTVVREVLSMIGPRLAVEMANVWTHADQLEGELVKECDASRLFRLSTLLGFVNERFDPLMGDTQWAETGDRYLLKLFRDYVFHRCDESGRPMLDFAVVVECLNRLDIGSPEQVLLSSRDGASLIAASYEDLRRCLMQAVDELRQRGAATAMTAP